MNKSRIAGLSLLTRVEMILSVLFLVCIILRSMYTPGSLIMLTITLPALAVLYSLRVYTPVPRGTSSVYPVILSKALRLSCCITVLGIWFMYLNLKGYSEMLLIGIGSSTLGCAFFVIFGLKKLERIRSFRLDIVRGLVLILLSITLLIEKNTG